MPAAPAATSPDVDALELVLPLDVLYRLGREADLAGQPLESHLLSILASEVTGTPEPEAAEAHRAS